MSVSKAKGSDLLKNLRNVYEACLTIDLCPTIHPSLHVAHRTSLNLYITQLLNEFPETHFLINDSSKHDRLKYVHNKTLPNQNYHEHSLWGYTPEYYAPLAEYCENTSIDDTSGEDTAKHLDAALGDIILPYEFKQISATRNRIKFIRSLCNMAEAMSGSGDSAASALIDLIKEAISSKKPTDTNGNEREIVPIDVEAVLGPDLLDRAEALYKSQDPNALTKLRDDIITPNWEAIKERGGPKMGISLDHFVQVIDTLLSASFRKEAKKNPDHKPRF